MAAYNLHRKIVEAPANVTEAAEICTFQCDPIKNPTGYCIPVCSSVCSPFCNTSVSSPSPQSQPPPPSPPLPPTGSYIITIPPKPHHSALSLPLKISLVILVLTFSLFLLYTLYKFYTVWYRSRRRRSPASPSPENQETHDEFLDHDVLDHPIWYIRTIGLQPSVINAISVVKYSKADGLIDGNHCSVCLSDFQEDETLRLLPKCNHAFHVSCIDTWLRSHTNCPLCRAGIVKNASNSTSLEQNLGDLDQIEETQIVNLVTEEGNEEQRQREDENQSSDLRIGVLDEDDDKAEIECQSGNNDFLIMRRSVSLNDYAACRIRSDIHNNNNNYYSDRHEFQLQSLHGELGLEVIKVEQQTANNCGEMKNPNS